MKLTLHISHIVILFSKYAYSFVVPSTTTTLDSIRRLHNNHQVAFLSKARLSGKSKDEDEDDSVAPGMMDAFRQLDSLGSIDNDTKKKAGSAKQPISADKSSLSSSATEETKMTPEKEAEMYTKMMKDLENTDDDQVYSDLMTEMGGDPNKKSQQQPRSPPEAASLLSSLDDDSDAKAPTKEDMDQFMDQALSEALDEVKLKSPESLSAESVLNNKEIMKEIEAIFDRGSEQLMQELEEIRKEQQSFAQKSAESTAQDAADAMSDDAARLTKAQNSMAAMLDRVSQEAVQVEQAAQDLRDAQKEMDKDFVVRLRNGGLPKQMALVGFLLFSVRSILDTLAAFNDESLLAGALVQGGIALVCAALFFLV